ncbi:MAG: hypothetical protein V3U84_03685, partial [Thiotrichaceae bacterium]
MPDSRDKDAERRAEAAFAAQQDLLNQQQQFLLQRNEQSQRIVGLLEQAEAGNVGAREQALSDLNRAISGEASPALQAFLGEEQLRTEEAIRRQLGPGGETSTPGIELQEASSLAQAKAIEQARQGDISAAVGATTGIANIEDARINRFLQAIDNPLIGSQVLGQSVAGLGKLSQFNVPQDTLARDIGFAGVSALGSQPNFFRNVGGNISG